MTQLEAALRAEIDRLRELKTPASRQLLNITKALLDEANAEVERLKAICRDQAGVELSEENDRLIAEIDRLRAENAKLRAITEEALHALRRVNEGTSRALKGAA